MKGSIACMLSAVRATLARDYLSPFYFVATSDEEVGYGGARHIVQHSHLYRQMVSGQTCAIIGEPTSMEVVYAHKGSTLITATAYGRAAHSSTHDGRNANLAMIPFLAEIKRLFDGTEQDPVWRNEDFDPPTMRWNICLSDNRPAVNVTASECVCQIYFRPMPGLDVGPLLQQCHDIAEQHGVHLEVDPFGGPMYTDPQAPFVQAALKIAGTTTARTVAYGTDGGALGELHQKIVLGPGSIAQAHTDDEWISLEQVSRGADVYRRFLHEFCLNRE
jgi:acetylornithine deacetylase